jgi:endonuclease YncB( thermonuclease family)
VTTADYLLPFVYNARALDVHDGDSVNVRVDWGFRRYDEPIPIRLLGCAARELADPGGPEARDNLTAILPAGTPLLLKTAKPDKFSPRWDAAVYYRDITGLTVDLVAQLIATGWAVPWNGTGAQPKPAWPRPIAATARRNAA